MKTCWYCFKQKKWLRCTIAPFLWKLKLKWNRARDVVFKRRCPWATKSKLQLSERWMEIYKINCILRRPFLSWQLHERVLSIWFWFDIFVFCCCVFFSSSLPIFMLGTIKAQVNIAHDVKERNTVNFNYISWLISFGCVQENFCWNLVQLNGWS